MRKKKEPIPDDRFQEVFCEREQDQNGDVHVMPIRDIIEHLCDTQCQCQPYWDEVNKVEYASGNARVRVYVHRRLTEMPN